MSIKITSPYGNFKSLIAAVRYIDHYHAADFISRYPFWVTRYPYDKSMDWLDNGKNHASQHYIHNVIRKELHGKMPGW